jgi:alpha-amylase/alpha-mannosidase (GH57 family)
MKYPETEFEMMYQQLTKCGVKIPRKLQKEDIYSFIDTKLQHGKTTLKDDSCRVDISTLIPPKTWETQDEDHIQLYREVMRLYCAMEDRTAFTPEFEYDDSIVNI